MLIPAADASFRRSMLLSAAKKKEPSPPHAYNYEFIYSQIEATITRSILYVIVSNMNLKIW